MSMTRKIIDIILFVSFIAMSTSGIMMFVVEKPSFSIQMHPVHKLFGLVMIAAVIGHLAYNYRMLLNYLKTTAVAITGGLMVVLLVVLYGVALNNQLPPELAETMDAAALQAE